MQSFTTVIRINRYQGLFVRDQSYVLIRHDIFPSEYIYTYLNISMICMDKLTNQFDKYILLRLYLNTFCKARA